jgi:hypothetical protein
LAPILAPATSGAALSGLAADDPTHHRMMMLSLVVQHCDNCVSAILAEANLSPYAIGDSYNDGDSRVECRAKNH